jgi:MFS family permease
MAFVGAQVRESGRAFGAVFRNPGLRRINLAFAASVIGDWAYAVAVSVWAYEHGGAAAVGLFGVARYVSMALLGPLLAVLADRYDKRRVMIVMDLARAAVVVSGAVVIAFDGPAVAVYAAGLITSIGSLAFRPAQAALAPVLADDPMELTGANVVASTIESLGFFAGPALGGLLLAVADVPVVYLVNAATFLVSAALLVGLRTPAADRGPHDPRADEADSGFAREALAGFATIRQRRDLRLIAALVSAQTVVAGASVVFEVGIAIDLLDLGESGVGLIGATLGVGGIVGGFVALVLARRQRLALDFGIGVQLWSAPLLLIVAFPSLLATMVAMFAIGVANSLVDINLYTIVQRLAPPEVMGRVFGALESLLTVGMALGALAMPLLIATIGLRAGLAVIGGAIAVVALAGLRPLRRIDMTVLAPPELELLQRRVPTFAVLPPPELERLAQTLVSMTVPPGTAVVREGDRGDRFWIIERGTAVVSVGGHEVRELGPGDTFGEIALLRDVPRTATVQAGPEPLALKGVDRDDFIPAVTGHGEAHEIADGVVERWLALG